LSAGISGGYWPSKYFEVGPATHDQAQFSFKGAGAGLAPVILAATVAAVVISRSPWPALIAFLIPVVTAETRWVLTRTGPQVTRRVLVWGTVLFSRTLSLTEGDSASCEVIEDSLLTGYRRPRWYRITLWVTALGREFELMRTNNPDDGNHAAAAINEAIKRICAKPAS
jgi:hypothetical protein